MPSPSDTTFLTARLSMQATDGPAKATGQIEMTTRQVQGPAGSGPLTVFFDVPGSVLGYSAGSFPGRIEFTDAGDPGGANQWLHVTSTAHGPVFCAVYRTSEAPIAEVCPASSPHPSNRIQFSQTSINTAAAHQGEYLNVPVSLGPGWKLTTTNQPLAGLPMGRRVAIERNGERYYAYVELSHHFRADRDPSGQYPPRYILRAWLARRTSHGDWESTAPF